MGDFLQFVDDFVFYRPAYLAVTVFIVVALASKYAKRRTFKHPPGPWGVPLLGYLPFLTELEHLDFCKLHKKYGRIIRLKMGVRPTVVLADFKAIKEAFNKQEVSARPPKFFELSPNVAHFGDMDCKDYKESRRFVLSTLRTLGMGKSKMEMAITEETGTMVENLRSSSGSDVNIHTILFPAITSLIVSLICGKNMKEDEEFSKSIETYTKSFYEYLRSKALLCFLPVLRPFISFVQPKLNALTKDVYKLEERIWKEIKSSEEEMDGPSTDNYMGHFIAEMRNREGKSKIFTREILNGNCQILLMAGLDTTITTIEWALLLLAQHPEVQEMAYKEIVDLIGKERPPTWDERETLPYLDAVLCEVSRFKTIVPLGDPHWTTSDTTIGGYDIPGGSVVFSNIYAVHMDSDLWTDPEVFNPNRFLTPDGKRIKDPEYFIPFSIGINSCIGEKLARVEVFLIVCTLLQNFKFLPSSLGIDLDGKLDLVYYPKHPIVRVESRD